MGVQRRGAQSRFKAGERGSGKLIRETEFRRNLPKADHTRRRNSEDGAEEEVPQKEENHFNALSSRGQSKPGKFWEPKEVKLCCLEGSE